VFVNVIIISRLNIFTCQFIIFIFTLFVLCFTCFTKPSHQSPAFLVGQIFVWQNAATCLSLRQEHSLANEVSKLQPLPSGTRFHHSSAYHPLVVDSLQRGWKPISSTPSLRTPLRTFVEERIILHLHRFSVPARLHS